MKEKYKLEFKTSLGKFAEKLQQYVSTETGEWSIKGFIDVYKNLYTISSDTKIISKILEIHVFPQIVQFAEEIGYSIILAEHQNYYPDLTFVNKENDKIKFAVDIKTTYRGAGNIVGFTLGSHGSYFKKRDKQKNIQFPYNQYSGHFCLGIIYTRADSKSSEVEMYDVQELDDECEDRIEKLGSREVTVVKNLRSITSVIKDLEFFVAEKWKIASDKQGSGNTANIGCKLSISDLRKENGVFSRLGEEWFDEYWMNFGTMTMIKDGKSVKITNIKDFLEFKGRIDLIKFLL